MTHAAAELGVTPAAVSLRIRNLESELGTQLFRRAGPRISPTEAARELGARLTAVLAEIEEAVDSCRQNGASIRITAVPTLASRWLAAALSEYQRENPTTHILVESTDEVRAGRSFDLSVRHGRGMWKGVSAEAIFGGAATPMISPSIAGQVREPQDLARLPLVPDDRWNAWFAQLGLRPDGLRFTTNYPSQELGAMAAVAGAGAALLSPVIFGSLLLEGKLVRPFKALVDGPDSYFLVTADHERRRGVLDLREFLLKHARGTRRGSGERARRD